jgi:hypothetical protein
MAEQTSKTARRSLVQVNTVRTPFHVFQNTADGKSHRPVASFVTKAEAEALASEINGYVFVWGDESRVGT